MQAKSLSVLLAVLAASTGAVAQQNAINGAQAPMALCAELYFRQPELLTKGASERSSLEKRTGLSESEVSELLTIKVQWDQRIASSQRDFTNKWQSRLDAQTVSDGDPEWTADQNQMREDLILWLGDELGLLLGRLSLEKAQAVKSHIRESCGNVTIFSDGSPRSSHFAWIDQQFLNRIGGEP